MTKYDLLVATDGGVSDTASVGAAVLFDAAGSVIARRSVSAGPLACSFSAETAGLHAGLDLLEAHLRPEAAPLRVALLSDSQGNLAALARGPLLQRNWSLARLWARLVSLSNRGVRLQGAFIFAHVGTTPNEIADAEVAAALPQAASLPQAPAWWVDEARPRWQLYAARHEAEAMAAAPFRREAFQTAKEKGFNGPWTNPSSKSQLPRNHERLLSQLRSGVCSSLPGWRHELPSPCPLCNEQNAFRRDAGQQVRHLFCCPALSVTRGSLEIADLFRNPQAVVSFAQAACSQINATPSA